jgi:hypothetical protein
VARVNKPSTVDSFFPIGWHCYIKEGAGSCNVTEPCSATPVKGDTTSASLTASDATQKFASREKSLSQHREQGNNTDSKLKWCEL